MNKLMKLEMVKMKSDYVHKCVNTIITLQSYVYIEGAPSGLSVSEILMENTNGNEIVELGFDDIDVDVIHGFNITSVYHVYIPKYPHI